MRHENAIYTIFISFSCFICLVLAVRCAVPYTYSYPGHKTFTAANIEMLRIGMSSSEVSGILGEPDEQYISKFGAAVGDEWSGRVWIYFIKPDPNLQHAKRYMKNMFVFYPPEGDMKLNHWEIGAVK